MLVGQGDHPGRVTQAGSEHRDLFVQHHLDLALDFVRREHVLVLACCFRQVVFPYKAPNELHVLGIIYSYLLPDLGAGLPGLGKTDGKQQVDPEGFIRQ